MTAKLVLDTRYTRKDNLFPICIRLRSGAQMKHIPCGHYVPEKAWGKGEVKRNYKDADIINSDILNQLSEATTRIRLAKAEGITDLKAITESKKKEVAPALPLFSDYLGHRAKQYDAEKKIKHAKKIRKMLMDLQECFEKKEIHFDLTTDDMRNFSTHLKNIGNATNTIRFKFEKLGQLFNNAVKERKTIAENVFENFKLPKAPVNKAKLTVEEIAAIEALALPEGIINDSRNLFLFSFYCKGMRFEDCLRFKREYISQGRVEFEDTGKGHKTISVKIHTRLQKLIDLYINNKTPYLFPMLKAELMLDKGMPVTDESAKERIAKVESQNTIVNRNLQVIIHLAGIKKKISMHNSRHTFAQHLKEKNVSINVIKEFLGHSNVNVTESYLKSLGDEALDHEADKIYG